jgi:hypothetical protein
MQLNQCAHDGQAQARALFLWRKIMAAPAKLLEDPALILQGNSHARIGHAKTDPTVRQLACKRPY